MRRHSLAELSNSDILITFLKQKETANALTFCKSPFEDFSERGMQLTQGTVTKGERQSPVN